jgi:mono/diheme cytochrome c family protein
LALAPLPLLAGPSGNTKDAKVIEAEKFVLRDAKGKKRGEFGLQADVPNLTLFDEGGTCRLWLALRAEGSHLLFFDKDGQKRAALSVPAAGEPRLEFFNKDGKKSDKLDGPSKGLKAASPVAAKPVASTAKSRESLRKAEELYRKLCVRCHGSDGHPRREKVGDAICPDFTKASWQTSRTDAQLRASILDGLGAYMPAFGHRLNGEQADAMVTYVRAFGPAPVQRVEPRTDLDKQLDLLQKEWEELKQQIERLRTKEKK